MYIYAVIIIHNGRFRFLPSMCRLNALDVHDVNNANQTDATRSTGGCDCLNYPLVTIGIFVAPPAGLSRRDMRAII